MDKILKILNSVCEGWIPEYKFISERKFKFDYGHLKLRIAIEIEGGIYTGTGHAKTGRYLSDLEKYNMAILRGWLLLRYAHGQENLIANDVRKAVEKRNKERIEKEIQEKLKR
jgi:hypothetical protein